MRSAMPGFFKQRGPNDLDHGVNFLQYLIVPEPEDSETSLLQSLIANTILVVVLMLTAIHLNNQLLFPAHALHAGNAPSGAGKVEHKIQEWMLASELETGNLPTAQALPQAILGIGHMASQLALKRIVDDRTVCLALHSFIPFCADTPSPSQPPP